MHLSQSGSRKASSDAPLTEELPTTYFRKSITPHTFNRHGDMVLAHPSRGGMAALRLHFHLQSPSPSPPPPRPQSSTFLSLAHPPLRSSATQSMYIALHTDKAPSDCTVHGLQLHSTCHASSQSTVNQAKSLELLAGPAVPNSPSYGHPPSRGCIRHFLLGPTSFDNSYVRRQTTPYLPSFHLHMCLSRPPF